MTHQGAQLPGTIRAFLAHDNLIVREGGRNLIDRHPDLQVVGVAADYDGVAGSRGWHAGDRHLLPAFSRAGEMTAIDIISGGRLELGIGAGWNEKSLRTSRRQPARPAVGLARNRGLIT